MKVSLVIKGLTATLVALLSFSCQKDYELVSEIYSSDFEEEPFGGLTGAKVVEFNGSQMLGNYHDDGFQLHLIDLPDHKLLRIDFDLWIIDTWDGNNNGDNGPDRWFMEVKKEWEIDEHSIGDFMFETTFSNTGDHAVTPCFEELGCAFQSYPGRYPSYNFPRTESIGQANGYCWNQDLPNGATLYQISQTIFHDFSELHLFFYDSLVQEIASTKHCNESWALDNLQIIAIDQN